MPRQQSRGGGDVGNLTPRGVIFSRRFFLFSVSTAESTATDEHGSCLQIIEIAKVEPEYHKMVVALGAPCGR